MLIRSRRVVEGPGPSEVVVEVKTVTGTEEVVVQEDNLRDGNLEIGRVLGIRDGKALIELPRESTTGKWRLWIPESEVLQTA